MTITEQLQFSVLTAPVATLDRRTLSQAWYSALYGNAGTGAREKQRPAQAASSPSPARGARAAAAPEPGEVHRACSMRVNAATTPAQGEGASQDRRAPRSALARKIERAFLRRPNIAHKASFTIDGEGGRVHVLLHSRGAKLELVAICPPKACPNVAAALAQARYALAMRGIDLDAHVRTQAPC